ncbi:MAG TPA: hypothetical protein VL305_00455 [Pseudolabrys sp.]|jgi:hypothetical protein|nr:hypothetical protein [Pseudolabrys sp.]
MSKFLVLKIATTFALMGFTVSVASALDGSEANNFCSGHNPTIHMDCNTPDGASCVSCAWCTKGAGGKFLFCTWIACDEGGCDSVSFHNGKARKLRISPTELQRR